MKLRPLFVLLFVSGAWAAGPPMCQPTPRMRAELRQAPAGGSGSYADFDGNMAPFLALRRHYPQDLFVHEQYQDAVRRFGIEGHLQLLVHEYQALASEHPGDVMYEYLFQRALIGRNTASVIVNLSEVLKREQNFAPVHRALADIYSTGTFRDPEKERAEHRLFQEICGEDFVSQRLDTVPASSPLVSQAERLLEENGPPQEAIGLATRGLQADEWRLQRIRPFDWYSVQFKIEQQQQLQAEYWQAWSLQVRAYRKAGQSEKAEELLKVMERRATALDDDDGPSAQWDGLSALARLYAEAKQSEQAARKLEALRQVLKKHPDLQRAQLVDGLQRELEVMR
jgi:uncharacterized protein YqiB (DUF1249 family)